MLFAKLRYANNLNLAHKTVPTLEELRKTRIEKLKKLQHAGLLAYPAKTNRTHKISDVLDNFKKLSGGILGKKNIVIAGRIMAKRGQGGLTFIDVNDGSGKLQAIIKTDKLGEKGYQFFLRFLILATLWKLKELYLQLKEEKNQLRRAITKYLQKHYCHYRTNGAESTMWKNV